jgi:hypothetical protein
MLAVCAGLVAAALAMPAAAQGLGGNYAVEGTNFDGSAYSGTATITLTSTTTCVIEWTVQGDTSRGICMRNENAFAAAYVLQGTTGLVVYEIKSNGVLDGLWTLAGQDGNGTEVLTPR